MQRGPRDYWRGLGRVERIFVLLTVLYGLLYFTGIAPGLASLVAFAAFFFGLLTLVRLARKAIWRLRNRLVVAYLFIAVVPIALILLLVVISAYVVVGQMAVYLVDYELSRRVSFLAGPACPSAVQSSRTTSNACLERCPRDCCLLGSARI